MGASTYCPKYYNPNWSQYSRKRKLWEAKEKRKEKTKNNNTTKDKGVKNKNT